MLHIHHAEDAQTPTKAYADACWAADPRISPDSWREGLGHTVGKLALDWQTAVTQPELLNHGVNLVLTSPATHPAAVEAIAHQLPNPRAVVTVLVTQTPHIIPTPSPVFLIWDTQNNAAVTPCHPTLVALEAAVKEGKIEAYGIAGPTLTEPHSQFPLHLWLDAATTAATEAWGRRKRPALRLLLAPMDLLNLSLLTQANTTAISAGVEEAVSPLELAARRGLVTLITAPTLPSSLPPAPEALAALEAVAHAERALLTHLGGQWPAIQGQPLFSVLAPLAHGQSPWPTPHHWQGWLQYVWPQLTPAWQTLAQNQQVSGLLHTYLNSFAALLPHGPVLSLAAAQPVLHQIIQQFSPGFPNAWSEADDWSAAAAILTSIPGVLALAAAPIPTLAALHMPNHPDVASLLTI